MKTFAYRALLTVVLCLIAPPAGTDAGSHVVRGKGAASNGAAFRFRASGTPSQATGAASFEWAAEGTLTGVVDCLWVDGRRAVISGVIDPPPASGLNFAIMVKDASKGEKPSRDLFYVQRSSVAYDCSTAFVPLPNTLRIKRGEINVD